MTDWTIATLGREIAARQVSPVEPRDTLQALAHLKPDLLSNDIFLRFGSQDNYTLFSPLYAAVISLLGVEPAASLLTFCRSH